MGIIDRINQRQAQSFQDVDAAVSAEEAEAAKPDAVVQSKEGRQAHKEHFRGMADQDLQEELAGPEEQALHTKMEQEMIQIVHSQNPGSTEALLKAVMTAEDPVQGIGFVASDVVQQVKTKHPNATQDILLSIGERTVEEVVELVELANPRINLNEDDMAEALSIGVEEFNSVNKDQVNPDDLQEFLANAPQ